MPSERSGAPVPIEELLAHGRWLKRLAASLVVGEEAAEELAQASMVQALTNPPQHGGNLKGWFKVVARNLARNQGTAARREGEHLRAAAELRARTEEEGARIVSRLELHRLLSDALLEIAPPLRDVLVLRFYDDLSFREIGGRLGVPTDTARSRVRRGLRDLRRNLDRRGGEDVFDWRAGILLWIGPGALVRPGATTGAEAGSTVAASLWTAALGGLLVAVAAVAGWIPWGGEPGDELAVLPGSSPGAVRAAEPVREGADVALREPLDGRVGAGFPADRVRISGNVYAFGGASPITGARLRLSTEDAHGNTVAAHAETDESGGFRFDAAFAPCATDANDRIPLREGHGVLRIEAEGFATLRTGRSLARLDGPGEGTLDADLGVLRMAPAQPVDLELRGAWGKVVGLWHGAIGERESVGDQLVLVGEWTESSGTQWHDRIGALLAGEERGPLIAWDGTGLGFAAFDPPLRPTGVLPVAIERLPDGAVRVEVHDASGRPIPDALVRATPLYWPLRSRHFLDLCDHRPARAPAGWDDARRARTDADGVARFEALPANPTGELAPPDEALLTGLHGLGVYRFCVGGFGTGRPHRLSLPVALRPGEELQLAWTLAPDAGAPLAGRVIDDRGRPVGGVRVVAIDRRHTASFDWGQGSSTSQETITDEAGRFAFARVDEAGQGIERIRVDGDGVGMARVEALLDVPPVGRTDCELRLPDAAALTGWLVGADGEPLALDGNVRLRLRPAGVPNWSEHPVAPEGLAVRADGSFSRPHLPVGRWTLLPGDVDEAGFVPFEPLDFEARGPVALSVPLVSFDAHATRVELVLGEGEAVGLASAVALRVPPDRGAPLVVNGALGPRARRAIFDALPPGDWTVHLRLRGGRRLWRSLVVDGSSPLLVEEVGLPPPGTLEGVLERRDFPGSLAACRVEARLVGPEWIDVGPDVERRFAATGRTEEVGSDGRFRFDALPPGRLELRVEVGTHVARATVQVEPAGVTSAALALRPARSLVLTGDLARHRALGHRLRLFVRGADGRWTRWPFEEVEEGVRARLPHDAREWEARWWTPGILGDRRSTPLEGRAAGKLDEESEADVADAVRARLPH